MTLQIPVPTGPRTAAHALNRLGFGPRPGDVQQVVTQGLAAWVAEQLSPTADPSLDARLSAFTTLTMTTPEAIAANLLDGTVSARVASELRSSKVIRAVHSKNQLQEVLVDFWFNHLNVYLPDGFLRFSTTSYERDAIRPFVLGKFKDLLSATANHPAMMFYLDNYLSQVSVFNSSGVLLRGLNENYGREILELHTVGVDAGYTQADVYDAARCFTGWGIDNVNTGGTFQYRSANHITTAKSVFGLSIAAGGQKDDGDQVIDYLAAHPLTAHRLCYRLAQRLVADDPPPALVDRCAVAYQANDGDLKIVMETLISSPEFWDDSTGRPAKIKTPVEYAISALRAVNAQVAHADSLRTNIANMGMPLYECIPPTGYSNRGADWLNPTSQLMRINFGLDLAAGRIPGATVDLPTTIRNAGGTPEDPRSVATVLNAEVLGKRLSPEALNTMSRVAIGTNPTPAAKVAGLCLASGPMQVK
jgi:uncharacterized protein (DUF1800 family)